MKSGAQPLAKATTSLFPKKAKTLTRTSPIRVYVENIGFEPITSCLPGKRSSQMS